MRMKKIGIIPIIIILLFSSASDIFVQEINKDKLLKKKQDLEKEIELTNQLLNDTRRKKDNSFQELKLLNSKINSRNKFIYQLGEEINNITKDIQKNSNKLQSLKADLEKSKNEYSELVYYAFKNSNSNINFMYLLASKDINQFYSRYTYLQQYKEYRLKQIKQIDSLKEEVQNRIMELELQKTEKTNTVNKYLAEKALLINDQNEIDNVIGILKQQETDLIKKLEEKKKLAEKLDKEIEDLIKKESKKNRYELLTPEEKILSDDFVKNKGRLPWPTERGVIIDHFGEHDHPVIKNLRVRNNGIDIATVPNTYARAVFNGEVSKVFTIKGANSTVIIRHGNYYTVYHNLKNVKVTTGSLVKTKDNLGEIYSDGANGQTTLHFEVWKELEKQNPEDWLSN